MINSFQLKRKQPELSHFEFMLLPERRWNKSCKKDIQFDLMGISKP